MRLDDMVNGHYYYDEYGTICMLLLKGWEYCRTDTLVLVEYEDNYNNSHPITKDDIINDFKFNMNFDILSDNKFYHSIDYYKFKPAYKAVKDTSLARKMYPKPFKTEKGYLYVRF